MHNQFNCILVNYKFNYYSNQLMIIICILIIINFYHYQVFMVSLQLYLVEILEMKIFIKFCVKNFIFHSIFEGFFNIFNIMESLINECLLNLKITSYLCLFEKVEILFIYSIFIFSFRWCVLNITEVKNFFHKHLIFQQLNYSTCFQTKGYLIYFNSYFHFDFYFFSSTLYLVF